MLDLDNVEHRMEGAVESLMRDFSGLRTGRASTSLLEPVHVDAYGSMMPLNQVATVGVPEPRLLTVQVWDTGLTKAVEKAIAEAGLGLNPQAEGSLIRVPIPDLSQERRQELVKVAHKYAESARIAVRNVRRDAMDEVKADEKNSEISEDDKKRLETKIQALTDGAVKKIDDSVAKKEKDIMAV
ncbi:MAG: ribosome recycling factor [Bdellovibrionales bacterium]